MLNKLWHPGSYANTKSGNGLSRDSNGNDPRAPPEWKVGREVTRHQLGPLCSVQVPGDSCTCIPVHPPFHWRYVTFYCPRFISINEFVCYNYYLSHCMREYQLLIWMYFWYYTSTLLIYSLRWVLLKSLYS